MFEALWIPSEWAIARASIACVIIYEFSQLLDIMEIKVKNFL